MARTEERAEVGVESPGRARERGGRAGTLGSERRSRQGHGDPALHGGTGI